MSNDVLFSIKNIYVKYHKNYIIKNLSLDINERDFFVILGPNGSGKSTLIKSLVRVNKLDSGYILYKDKFINLPFKSTLWFKNIFFKMKLKNAKKKNNKELIELYTNMINDTTWLLNNWKLYSHFHSKKFGTQVAYVPQLLDFPENTTVYDFVKLGRFPHSNLLGVNYEIEKENEIIMKALKDVGLENLSNAQLSELSGGQKQKALIGLALAQETDTIILDEPTNHLDIKSQLEIMELLNHFHKEHNKTIIMIIHDINMGIKYANRTMLMKNGEIVSLGSVKDVVTKENIKLAFDVDIDILENDEGIKITEFWIKK